MSNLTQKQREKESADIFCGPHRSFPIKDCSDVGDAAHLIGKAENPDAVRSCVQRRAKAMGCSLPKAWQSKQAKMSAFSAGFSAVRTGTYLLDNALFASEPPPGYVRRSGKIFELGEYPDNPAPGMVFSLTEDEADRAIAQFTPVMGDLEHRGTVLDGKLGVMRKVWREGRNIMGQVDVPAWLHEQLPLEKSKVSTAWDFVQKTLEGWGWVKDPAIPDAALFSAYAQFAARQKQQEAEEFVAPSAPSATMLTPRQQKGLRFMPLQQQLQEKLSALFSKQKTETQQAQFGVPGALPDLGLLQQIAAQHEQGEADTKEDRDAGEPPKEPPKDDDKKKAVSFSAPGSADEPMDEGLAEFRAQQIIARASEAADRLIAQGHVHSYGRNALIAAFTAAGYDNEQNGPSIVTFSKSNGQVLNDRVALLVEAFEATPKHSLFSDNMPVYALNGDRGAATKENEAMDEADRQAQAFNEGFASLFGGKVPGADK